MFDYRNNIQRFFNECSDIITSLTIHPKYPIMARKAHEDAVISIEFFFTYIKLLL